jgi:hypothetical protein
VLPSVKPLRQPHDPHLPPTRAPQPRRFLPHPEAEARRSNLTKVAIGDAVKAGNEAAADDDVEGVGKGVAAAVQGA